MDSQDILSALISVIFVLMAGRLVRIGARRRVSVWEESVTAMRQILLHILAKIAPYRHAPPLNIMTLVQLHVFLSVLMVDMQTNFQELANYVVRIALNVEISHKSVQVAHPLVVSRIIL